MKTAYDATRPLVFEINGADVLNAKRKDKRNCVIACALKAIPGIKSIEVGSSIVHVDTPDGRARYRTTPLLRKALTKFDSTGLWDLPPGIYTLPPPSGALTQDRLRKRFNARYKNGRPLNPKTGKRYAETGKAKRKRTVNPRVLEFAKMRVA